jgi:hypothetical protein
VIDSAHDLFPDCIQPPPHFQEDVFGQFLARNGDLREACENQLVIPLDIAQVHASLTVYNPGTRLHSNVTDIPVPLR